MEKSTSIKNIAAALSLFHVKVETISKDSSNPFFKSKYASLSNILKSVKEPLIQSGLVFSQLPNGENGLTTILIHTESGEFIQADYTMQPTKNDPQGKGSAITYQRRYALSAVLGLDIDDDDDGNAASAPAQTKNSEAAPQTASENLPWLNETSKEFIGAVAKLKAGKTTIPTIRKYFRISKKIETLLIEKSKAA
jgi:hypothetical protein